MTHDYTYPPPLEESNGNRGRGSGSPLLSRSSLKKLNQVAEEIEMTGTQLKNAKKNG